MERKYCNQIEEDGVNFDAIIEYADVVVSREIQSLRHKLEEQEKENTDLKELYIRVAKNLEEKGKTELAEYMLAQIEAVPTFTTWEEYTTWVSKEKIRKILKYYEHAPADNPDTTMAFYSEISKLLEEEL